VVHFGCADDEAIGSAEDVGRVVEYGGYCLVLFVVEMCLFHECHEEPVACGSGIEYRDVVATPFVEAGDEVLSYTVTDALFSSAAEKNDCVERRDVGTTGC